MKAKLLTLTSVCVLALVGCSTGQGTQSGDSAQPGETGTAEWNIPDKDPEATIKVLSILNVEKDGVQPVLDAFAKEHPTIKVEFESVPFADLNSVLDARITSKTGDPDVFWADQPRIPSLAARGYTEDLSAQFSEFTGEWDASAVESSSYDGKLWAVPIANSTQLLFYNRDLLKQAGVDEPSVDPEKRMTWEELAEDAAKVQAGSDAQYGMMFGQFDRYYQLQPLPESLGGGNGATGEDNLEPAVNSEPWVSAMEWYGELFEQGIAPRGKAEMQEDFLADKVAYIQQGPWLLPDLENVDFEWGVALNPMFDGGEPITPTGSWSLAMNPFSKEKEAAAIFMRWMSVDDGGNYTNLRLTPELPANKEGKEIYYTRDIFQTDEGRKAVEVINYETENTAVPRVSTVGYVEFEDITGRAFSDIRNGGDPKEVLDRANTELADAWAKYK